MNIGHTDRNFSWVVADDGDLTHVEVIGRGGSGDVHKVFELAVLRLIDRRSKTLSRTR